jgi:hypothetical protein
MCCCLNKGGGCKDVDDHVELLTRQGIQGKEQRWLNVVSPEVRVSEKHNGSACQREVRGDGGDLTPCSSVVARTVEGGSWNIREKETRSLRLGFESCRERGRVGHQ